MVMNAGAASEVYMAAREEHPAAVSGKGTLLFSLLSYEDAVLFAPESEHNCRTEAEERNKVIPLKALSIEGHTDSKGYFSIQLGANNVDAFVDAFQDASNSSFGDITQRGQNPTGDFNNGGSFSNNNSSFSERALAGCELRANIPGYVSHRDSMSR
jgi:hypothetical protein